MGQDRGSSRLSVLGLTLGLLLMALAAGGAALSPTLTGTDRPVADPSIVDTSAPAPTPTDTAMATPTPTPTATPTPRPTPTVTRTTTRPPSGGGGGIAALEDDVFARTNVERAKAGCPALRLDSRLRTAARAHSVDMATYDYFSHTGRDGSDPGTRMRRAGYDTDGGWAENIAAGYATPSAVMQGWMGSDGHRRNILNCDLRALGVGVGRDARGRLYWTQDFGGR